MIVDVPDGKLSRQGGDISTMIDIEVRDEQVVDAAQTGGLDSFQNSIRGWRPVIKHGPADVDEERLSGGRNEQDTLASLDIDSVHVERIGGPEDGNEKNRKQSYVEDSHGDPFSGYTGFPHQCNRKPTGGGRWGTDRRQD